MKAAQLTNAMVTVCDMLGNLHPEDHEAFCAIMGNRTRVPRNGGDPIWGDEYCDKHMYTLCPDDCEHCHGNTRRCCLECHEKRPGKFYRGEGGRKMQRDARREHTELIDKCLARLELVYSPTMRPPNHLHWRRQAWSWFLCTTKLKGT